MIKQYWMEIIISLGMTFLLAFSFSANETKGPSVPASVERAQREYQSLSLDQPFLEGQFQAAKPAVKGQTDWDIKVWKDGRVSVVAGGKTTPVQLEPTKVKMLLERLRREAALELRSKLPKQTEGPLLTLRLKLVGGTEDYSLHYNQTIKSQPEARRFLRIWADLITDVPSPNHEKPMEYL